MKNIICCLINVFFLISITAATETNTANAVTGTNRFIVRGKVFLDGNKNGIADKNEAGLENVYVSNGIDFTPTDKSGNYTIAVRPDIMPFVYVIQPAGYQTLKSFYKYLPVRPDARHDVNFGLTLLRIPDVEEKGLTFFHISDMHIPMFLGRDGLTNTLKPLVERLVTELKQADGQFILNTGDTMNEGAPGQWKDFTTYILPAFTCPTWHVPGNHDFFSKKGEMDYTNLDSYNKILGPNYYSFNYLDNHFIVLDNCRNTNSATYKVQIEWLQKDVRIFSGKYRILLVGHARCIENQLIKDEKDFFKDYKITAAFNGHEHCARVWKCNDIMSIQAPVFNCAIGLIDGMDWGYIRVNIKGDKVTTRLCFLDGEKNAPPVKPDVDAGKVETKNDWPMFQHDPAHSGYTADRVRPPLKLKWMRKLADHFHMSSPVVAGNLVIAGLSNEDIGRGGVIALDAVTGNTVWNYKTETAVRHTPCCAAGLVFFTTSGGDTFAVQLSSGNMLWTKEGSRQGHSSHTVFSNTLFAAIGQRVMALDIQTGRTIAQSATTEWEYSNFTSPAVNKDGLLFHGGIGLSLFCFDPQLKTVWHWERKDGKQPFPGSQSSVVAGDDKIFWAANSALAALDARTMEIIWKFPLGKGRIIYPTPVSTPGLDQDSIYLASEVDGKLYALDKNTGVKRWEYQTGDSLMAYGIIDSHRPCIFGNPVISDKTVYFGAHDGYLHAVDSQTGRGIFKYFLGTPITSSPAVSGNAIFVAGMNGYLYCFVGQNDNQKD